MKKLSQTKAVVKAAQVASADRMSSQMRVTVQLPPSRERAVNPSVLNNEEMKSSTSRDPAGLLTA